MASFVTIEVQSRASAGKGPARATRRAGRVPAVVYGGQEEPALISIDPKVVHRELHRGGWRSRLFELSGEGSTERALIRDVQFHPLTDLPQHVDFQRLRAGQPIRVAVSVVFLNEGVSPGLKRGGVLNVVRHDVEVLCDPDQVPERFEVDLGTLDIGDNIRWHDLKGAEHVRPVITDRDFVIATVAAPTKMAEVAAEPGAAPAAAAPAAAAKAPAAGKAPAAKAAAPAKPAAKK